VLEGVLHEGRGADHGPARVVERSVVGVVEDDPAGQGAIGLLVGGGVAGVVDAAGSGEAPAFDADAGGEVAAGAELDEGECHGVACLMWGTGFREPRYLGVVGSLQSFLSARFGRRLQKTGGSVRYKFTNRTPNRKPDGDFVA